MDNLWIIYGNKLTGYNYGYKFNYRSWENYGKSMLKVGITMDRPGRIKMNHQHLEKKKKTIITMNHHNFLELGSSTFHQHSINIHFPSMSSPISINKPQIWFDRELLQNMAIPRLSKIKAFDRGTSLVRLQSKLGVVLGIRGRWIYIYIHNNNNNNIYIYIHIICIYIYVSYIYMLVIYWASWGYNPTFNYFEASQICCWGFIHLSDLSKLVPLESVWVQ